MSTKKYRIRLTTDEQQELNALVSRGRAAAYKQTHARILLMSDESRSDGGMKDADITSALGVGQSTVERIRKRCVEEGVESALNRKTVDSDGLRGTAGGACQLDQLRQLVERRDQKRLPRLKKKVKKPLKRWPGQSCGVWMEDVLEVYQRPDGRVASWTHG